jgi:hypothetical protein
MKFSFSFGNSAVQEELNQFAKKMEKFDDQQQPGGKLSGGAVALIVCACLMGAGLIGFLFWLALRKKKN